jgi:hypothetical protein
MNEDENMICDGCGDERPAAPSIARTKPSVGLDVADDEELQTDSGTSPNDDLEADRTDEKEDLAKSSEPPTILDKGNEDNENEDYESPNVITKPSASSSTSVEEDEETPPTRLDNQYEDFEPPKAITAPPAKLSTRVEDEETPPTRLDNQYEDFEPPKAITAPPAKLSTRVEDEETPNLSFTSQRLYMVFVNTPAQSLVKSRVAIEFDVFPVISIGRNPENVVVVPDQEVSRKHARLSLEGGKVILKDLQSANGTFVYDGKQFQRVNGSVEIKPNTILKFGSGTIVRLINE